MKKFAGFCGAFALLSGTALLSMGGKAAADIVHPDDVIIQGSLCVGFDCANGEVFSFDTIRLKENNLRIKFEDTSVGAFPTNDWQITANDSASGGASYLAFDDVTGNRQPFRVTAGAPTGSLFVASTGRVGLRTTAPVLDLHINTSNTPAHRLEQNNSGGFTAQTWDIGANEANFFVRDVTSGSRLPFRIRPGAPTSSIDIAADGNVGIGLAGADFPLSVASIDNAGIEVLNTGSANKSWRLKPSGTSMIISETGLGDRMTFITGGNVGIGTNTPAAQFHTTATVRFAGVAGCGGGVQTDGSGNLGCLVSSRQFKNVTGDLPSRVATANIMALRPQVGSYKQTPDVAEHWLIAEDVAAVDPALAGFQDGKPYVVKTQNVVADLIAVVQQQQRRIDQLEQRLQADQR